MTVSCDSARSARTKPNWALLGMLDAGAAVAIRVLLEQVVVDCGREDAAQQPVALRRGRRTRARAARQAGMSRPDHRGLEIGQDDWTQRREYVEAQAALVELVRGWAQQRALTQPARRRNRREGQCRRRRRPMRRARWPSGLWRGTRARPARSRTSAARDARNSRRDSAPGTGLTASDGRFRTDSGVSSRPALAMNKCARTPERCGTKWHERRRRARTRRRAEPLTRLDAWSG